MNTHQFFVQNYEHDPDMDNTLTSIFETVFTFFTNRIMWERRLGMA